MAFRDPEAHDLGQALVEPNADDGDAPVHFAPTGGKDFLRKRRACVVTLVCVAIALVAAAIVLPILLWDMFRSTVQESASFVTVDSGGYAEWQDSAVSANRTFWMYMFEVQNPEGFVQNGEKLRVEERGPFIYNMRVQKVNVSFDTDNEEVSYYEWTTYEFDAVATRTATNGKYDSDTKNSFLVVDLLFWGFPAQAGVKLWRDTEIVFGLNETQRMFKKLTPAELKDGYNALPFGPIKFPGLQPQLEPEDLGMSTVRTGASIPADIAQYTQWHGSKAELTIKCPWGKTEGGAVYCPQGETTDNSDSGHCCDMDGNMEPVPVWQWPVPGVDPDADKLPETTDAALPNHIVGTDGNQFGVPLQQSVAVFADPLNRHILLNRTEVGTLKYVEGIALDVYELPIGAAAAANATVEPYNAAYYMFGPGGVQNATTIQQGAPVYVTSPHFYGVGPEAADRVEGLSPDEAKHSTYLGIEPVSGLTMYSHQRIQLNVQVSEQVFSDGHKWFTNLMPGETYVPLAWIDEFGQITPDALQEFTDGQSLVAGLAWGAAITFGVLAIAAVVGAAVVETKTRQQLKLVQEPGFDS